MNKAQSDAFAPEVAAGQGQVKKVETLPGDAGHGGQKRLLFNCYFFTADNIYYRFIHIVFTADHGELRTGKDDEIA